MFFPKIGRTKSNIYFNEYLSKQTIVTLIFNCISSCHHKIKY